jgi:chromosome segregation ATPase
LKRKQEISDSFLAKDDEVFKKVQKSLETHVREIGRYRKERDEMREMYESANSQVSSITKTCSHLQLMIDGLKAKIQSLESYRSLESSNHVTDASLLEELTSIEKAYDSLREHNETLIRECTQKETALGAAAADKIKADFKMAQALKEAEIQMKKADEMEILCLNKLGQVQARERTLLNQNASLETESMEKSKAIDESRKRLNDLTHAFSELEKEKRSLAGDLEEVPSLVLTCPARFSRSQEKARVFAGAVSET